MARITASARTPFTQQARQRGYISARAVGSYVPKLTHKAFEKYGFAAAALITDWAIIVGKDVATYTSPERLKWPRGAGYAEDAEEGSSGRPGAMLIVRVEPARALDVQYKAHQLIERINGHFGYRAVAELRILQAPLSQRPAPARTIEPPRGQGPIAAPELADIGDERLRLALSNLKSGLMRRGQGR
ncbi:MAG: DciA family protein [Hyphomicrobium sp.]|jgi:hypothetical protein